MDDARRIRALKALADPTRFRMVQELHKAGELTCGQLGEKFDLAQPTISHHLKLLTTAGIAVARTEAQHHFVSVDVDFLSELLAALPAALMRPSRRAKRT